MIRLICLFFLVCFLVFAAATMADDSLTDYPHPLVCYPVFTDENGIVRRGDPVILLWANLKSIDDRLRFKTLDDKVFSVPAEGYICEQR